MMILTGKLDHPCLVNIRKYYYTDPKFFESKPTYTLSKDECDRILNDPIR